MSGTRLTYARHIGGPLCDRATLTHDCPRQHEYEHRNAPIIHSITRVSAMAGHATYRVSLNYGDHGGALVAWFRGPTTPGYPGPAYFRTEAFKPGHWERIEDPQRFGSDFNAAWLERFYGQGERC